MKLAFCNSCLRSDFDYDMIQVCPDCNFPLTPGAETSELAHGPEKDIAEVPEFRQSKREEEELRKAWIKMLNEAINRYRLRVI